MTYISMKLHAYELPLTPKPVQYKLIWFLFLLMLLPAVPGTLPAQNYNMSFKRVSIEDGLSQSSIEDIYQDERGFLWFATQDGLNRYDGYNFKIFKHLDEDSLSISDDWINTVTGDGYGNLWIGTQGGGLNRFDRGTEKFEYFYHDSKDEQSISSNNILTLLADKSGFLWIGTDGGGLDRLDIKNKQIRHFKKDQANPSGLGSDKITVIYQDKSEVIWIGTAGGGLYSVQKYNSGQVRFTPYAADQNRAIAINSNDILSIFEDARYNLWIGTQNGLMKLDKERKFSRIYLADASKSNSLSNGLIYSIFSDQSGFIWLATDAGLNILDPVQEKFWRVQSDQSNSSSLSSDLLRCIYEDSSGTIWIGTYGAGLNHFDWKKKRFGHYKNVPGDPNSLTDNAVWSILVDQKENLWLGTSKGVNRFDKKTNALTVFRSVPDNPNTISDDLIRVIYEDKNGMIWFGTNGGGLCRYNPLTRNISVYKHDALNSYSISSNTVRTILEDHFGNLWIGTWAGLDKFDRELQTFYHFKSDPDDPGSLSDDRVRCLFEDKKGFIWVGTYKGLNKFNPVTKNFIHYLPEPKNASALSHERVSAIRQDQNGYMWIGTLGGGLNRFDPDENVFIHFAENDGMPNNTIYGLLEDDQGFLWISTNRGLSRMDPRNNTFRNFDANDGLQSNEFNGGAYFKSTSGELIFGGINGYNRFNPQDIQSNSFIPPLLLTSFKIFDREVKLDSAISEIHEVRLPYQKSFFAFEFAALDYTNSEKNKYAYKLEGFDQDWIQCGIRRYANYTNLDGGEYIFKVIGTNSDGVWNLQGASIKITIVPPFWKTWWFRIGGSLLVLSLVFSFYSTRMKRIKRQRIFLESQVAERTQELKERNRLLSRSKKETDNIMNNVEEGIFLIDLEFKIRSQHSRALEKIFDERRLARKNILEVLEKKINKKIFSDLQDYLELMFKNDIDEETLKDLNPVSETEFNFRDENDVWLKSKYLSFKFKRIMDDEGKINELIVTVNDLSDQILLARKLEESLAMSKKQMDWLLSIMHVEPKLLKEFSQSAYLELNYIDKVLKQNEQVKNFVPVLEKVYRSMHLMKGNATLLDLKFFVEKAHEFEDKIEDLKKKPNLRGSDFVPLVLRLGDIRRTLDELHNLIERVSNVHSHFRPKRSYESELFIKSIQNLINNLAQDQGKKVKLIHDRFDAGNIPYHYRLTTREIIIQMVRNALYHGIEKPEERVVVHKDTEGSIELVMILNENYFGFSIRDDGRGLQIEKLRAKARSSGIWTPAEIEQWSDQQVAQVIYKSGISTAENVGLVAGRGVGMDLVKDKIDRLGGEINIDSKAGEYCEFTVMIPLNNIKKEVISQEKILVTAES